MRASLQFLTLPVFLLSIVKSKHTINFGLSVSTIGSKHLVAQSGPGGVWLLCGFRAICQGHHFDMKRAG